LHVLSGSVIFRAGAREERVAAGELIVLETAIAHDVEALEESSCLLTLSLPAAVREGAE
jgi:quercetin dioxygenase-like cupin family protein